MVRHIDILAKFLDMFPDYVNKVSSWSPAGNQCIRIEMKNFMVVEFSYFGDDYWKLCTPGFDLV